MGIGTVLEFQDPAKLMPLWTFLGFIALGGIALAQIDFRKIFLQISERGDRIVKIIGVFLLIGSLLAGILALILPQALAMIVGLAAGLLVVLSPVLRQSVLTLVNAILLPFRLLWRAVVRAYLALIRASVTRAFPELLLGAVSKVDAIPALTEDQAKQTFVSSTEWDQFWDGVADKWVPAKRCYPIHASWGNIEGGTWIWLRECVTDEQAKTGGSVQLRRKFEVPLKPRRVIMKVLVDDRAKVSLNGSEIAEVEGFTQPQLLDLLRYTVIGWNEITMEVTNTPRGPQATSGTNPTGVMYRIDVEY